MAQKGFSVQVWDQETQKLSGTEPCRNQQKKMQRPTSGGISPCANVDWGQMDGKQLDREGSSDSSR